MQKTKAFDSKYSVRLVLCRELAFGWLDTFAPLGIGVLVVGPLQIHLTWPVDETALGT